MRAAVSRAYYAALQSAKVRLKEKDFDRNIPNDRGIHRYVIEQFRDHPEEARKKIGVDLDRPRKQRDKADYSEVYRDLDQQAELCLKFAQRVRSGLETLPD
jgi:uncharacterized protein (UPF0332 family)